MSNTHEETAITTPEDALLRYDHVRSQLAEIDGKLHEANLTGLIRQGLRNDREVAHARELLADQAEATEAFAQAIHDLDDALSAG